MPYCPPKPTPLPVEVISSSYEENMLWLWQTKAYADVAFIVGNVELPAHKFVLAAASSTFYHLFCMDDDISQFEMGRSSSESSLVCIQ